MGFSKRWRKRCKNNDSSFSSLVLSLITGCLSIGKDTARPRDIRTRSLSRIWIVYGKRWVTTYAIRFAALEEDTYRRQGLRVPHTREYLKQLYSAAKERNSGECWAAIDPKGVVHCASFSVWDARTMSALVLGNSEQRNSGATSLLEWHMLQFAAQNSKVFDFCGSYVEGIERFVRSFGGTRVPYYQITRFPKLLRAYLSYVGKI
jgi:hypothetical protein